MSNEKTSDILQDFGALANVRIGLSAEVRSQGVRAFAQGQGATSVHHVFVTEGETGRSAMLQRAGYAPARHFLVAARQFALRLREPPVFDRVARISVVHPQANREATT